MNEARLSGVVVSDVVEESTSRGETFYTFDLSITRQSGVADIILCRVSERCDGFDQISKDRWIRVEGRYSSYRKIEGASMRLCLSVFVTLVQPIEIKEGYECENSVELEGTLSKIKDLKEISTRTVLEMNLLVPRGAYGRQDLIPIVTWGRTATYCHTKLSPGQRVRVTGRIQSRERVGEDGGTYRIYNVSVIDLEVVNTEEAV